MGVTVFQSATKFKGKETKLGSYGGKGNKQRTQALLLQGKKESQEVGLTLRRNIAFEKQKSLLMLSGGASQIIVHSYLIYLSMWPVLGRKKIVGEKNGRRKLSSRELRNKEVWLLLIETTWARKSLRVPRTLAKALRPIRRFEGDYAGHNYSSQRSNSQFVKECSSDYWVLLELLWVYKCYTLSFRALRD